MKNLVQHIESLLIQHECVIVPSLGGFITYRDKAIIRNNRLYAPSQHIRFNHLLTYHDGLLAEAYMQDRQISYTEALNAIKNDVKQITTSLNAGNTFLFGRIGSLSQINGNITLHNNDCNFLPENIGLPIVQLKQLASTQPTNTITINIPQASSNIVRYVAMLVVVFIFSLLIPTPVTDSTHEASFYKIKNIEYTTQITNTPPQPSDMSESSESSESSDKHQPSDKPQNSSLKKYHLIIASLTSREDAEEYIANHTQFDRTQLQIIESNDKYRISAISFAKYKEAIQYADSVRNNVPTAPKAWILCK